MSTKTKKVMLFSPSLSGGGAERVMLNVALELSRLGYEVDFVVKNDWQQSRYEVPPSFQAFNLDAHKLLDTAIKLARRIKTSKPAIVITALESLGLAAILAKGLLRHKPIVVPSVHTMLETWYRELPSPHTKRYRNLIKHLYPYADHIIAVSQGAKDEILAIAKLNQDKVSVLYNPVIADDTLKSIDQPVEHPWFTAKKTVAIAVGRLVREKNYPLMLRAIAEARKHIDLHLIVLGEGELRASLEEEAQALGIADYVDFHGFVNHPLAYVGKSDMFLLTSSWEGLGNVLIEAMATGTPIISTDCESGPREVLENGKWGILVPPNNVDSFTKAIIQVAEQGGIVPDAHSWARFTVAEATAQYAKLIDSL